MEFIQENLINWLLLTVIYILCLLWNVLYYSFKESKLKKEHEDQLAKERIEWEDEREKFKKQREIFKEIRNDLEEKLIKENKSNSANQGWNTKYRKTIEELEQKNKDQADTIKRLINKKWK